MIRNVKVTRREAAQLQSLVDSMNASRRDVAVATAVHAARVGLDPESVSFEGVAGNRIIFAVHDPAPPAPARRRRRATPEGE